MELSNHFQDLTLTTDQNLAVEKLNCFLNSSDDIFMLKGYAGSGKTTLISGLISFLKSSNKEYSLFAPTGRAAKVIIDKTQVTASTIHRGIYDLTEIKEVQLKDDREKNSFKFYFDLKFNQNVNSVFIIDEASMISNARIEQEFFQFGSGFLLDDLIRYSRIKNESVNTKIIFVGDPAQLPPVSMNFSPALDSDYIKETYQLKVDETELSEVVRQEKENSVLKAATKFRKCISSGYFNDFNLSADNKNIYNYNLKDFVATYNSIEGNKVVITYKNKTADSLNKTIRIDKFGENMCIQPSDIILIGKNNYQHNIVNGDFGIVNEVDHNTISREVVFNKKDGRKEFVTLTWRKISLIIFNENRENTLVDGYMLENFIDCDNNLSPILQQALYVDFINRHRDLKPGSDLFKEVIRQDIFFNAVQLKYGYAVTCHKAQGGEWDNVLVVWDYSKNLESNQEHIENSMKGNTNESFYRWAYTAITRPSMKLYSFNTPFLSPYSKMLFIDPKIQLAYKEHADSEISPKEITEIDFSIDLIRKYDIANEDEFIKNHFIKMNKLCEELGLKIESIKRIGYELQYILKQNDKRIGMKFWFNGKGKFNNKTGIINCENHDNNLFNILAGQLYLMEYYRVKKIEHNDSSDQVKFDYDNELSKTMPFLNNMFDQLSNECLLMDIVIKQIDHLDWKERYYFTKDNFEAVIDFEYNSKGSWGRILPIENKCNSSNLILDIKTICNLIKEKNEL